MRALASDRRKARTGPQAVPHAKEGKSSMYAIRSQLIGRAGMAFAVLAPVVLISAPVLGKDAQSYVGNAQRYAAKGDLKAAEIELRNALREAPQDAHIHAMLAQIYLTLGEFASAEREARSARDLKADEADYILTLGEAMSRQGKFADIQAQIKADQRAPELESKVRLILATAAASLGDRVKAETLLRDAVTADQRAPGPKVALARWLISSNLEEAGKLVEEALAVEPRSADAIVVQGEILAKQGKIDGAIERFSQALEIDPKNMSARLSRANVNLSRGDYNSVDNDLDPVLKASPENFAANYIRALEHFKKHEFAEADKMLDRLSPNFSHMPEGFYVQAATKYALGENSQASAAIAKYVDRVPDNPFGVRLAALIAIRRGAADAAVQYLTGYLAKAKPDAQTLALLGNVYAATGKPGLALEQFEKAAALEPENLSLKTMVAASEISTGAGRKGLDELEQVFATDAGATVAGPTLVLTDVRAGRFDKAAETAEQLVKRDAANPLYQVLLGIVRTGQRDYAAAETIFKAIVDKAPDFAPARTNLAHVYMAAGKLDEARKTYEDFLARKPNDVAALLGLVEIAVGERQWDQAIQYAKQARDSAPSDPTPGLALLNVYSAHQDWEPAKNLASQLTAQFPSNAVILDAQARVLAASGDRDGAIQAYRRAYEIAPNSGPILSRYLSLLASAKRFPEYKTLLQARLDKDPGNREIKTQLIRVETEVGGLDAGLSRAQSFAKEDRDSAVYDLISAELYERAGKRSDAIALLEKTASARPMDDGVAIALASLYDRAENATKAEAVLSNRLKERPDAVTVRTALGESYIRNKKFAPAIDEYNRVLSERPDDPAVLNNLAWLHQQIGELPKARELAEKAAGIAPTNGSVVDTLGWILLAQGDTANALTRLQAASAATPGDPEIRYHVAVALGRAGRTADARQVLEQLLGSGASFTSKADAEKLLNELKRG
jgi:putative PEP-CTERM system TPR-repeat lipoprotein